MTAVQNLSSDDEIKDVENTIEGPNTETSAEDVSQLQQLPENEHDGGYGWVCVACQLMITASTWGVNGAFGVYLTHYISTNEFPGTSEIAYSFIGGLSQSQTLLIAPLVTHATKLLGTKPPLFIGAALEAGALVGASFATQSWQLFLSQGLLFGWGCSFLYIGTIGLIPQWFARRKGIATGIAAAGSGLGGLIYNLSTEAMISNLSVAWAFRITAICTAVTNVVCIILIKDRNKHIQPFQNAFDFRLLKRPALLLIIAWMFLSVIGYTCVLFSLPDNATRIGLTAHQGAILGALANLGMMAGPMLADAFGIKLLPSTLSILWTSSAIPSAFAEAMALGLRRTHKPVYLDVQIFSGCMFIGAALLLLPLRFRKNIKNLTSSEKN
ncbi:hypothetical protein MKX08_004653 [Trichoderma sp. CBMAI-0020]|nr:hypothetical protein MKX08_004653 [Trichoderma sp. CBMAI-0020]